MPEPLKNVYDPSFFNQFTKAVGTVIPAFKDKDFLEHVFDEQWQARELKQRMRHIAFVLQQYMPGSFKKQTAIIINIIQQLERQSIKGGFEHMFLPDFIEQFGLNDRKTSLAAMERITQFTSCEFAIRPFLLQHQQDVMQQMLLWSKHPHHHVRRFASEGCRPRLPWAMAIPALKKDPLPILPILENLKADHSLFVRKSVANNLNDIAKDHSDVVAEVAKNWKGVSAETDWIIRHGCRTLLKKAHPSTYALFAITTAADCKVSNLQLSHGKIKIGDRLGFSFQLQVGRSEVKLRLEYAVYYRKANDTLSRKIFQIKEATFAPEETYSFKKEQRFQDFTTRKHYPGQHKLVIVVNGQEMAAAEFRLEV